MSRRPARSFLVDVTPLREAPRFRWLFAAHGIGWVGRQITVVAVPIQVYDLTGSTVAVGTLGLVQFIATLLVSFAGGAVADAVDRRRLLVVAQAVLAATAGGLAWNASTPHPSVTLLFVLTALSAAITAVELPTRAAVIPNLVSRDLLASTYALNQTLGNVAKAAGPAIAGVLIATADLPVTYLLEAAAFLAGAALIWRVGPLPPEGGGTRPGWKSIAEGFRFLRERRILRANFAIDLNAMIFGMPSALFPAIGTEVLGGDASTVGLLYSAPGIGALAAALTSGWVGTVRRQGRAVVISVMIWGAAIAAFGFARALTPAAALLIIAGGADVISAVFRNTILQMSVPDSLRGRLSGIHIAVVSGGPRLGDFEAGAVAALVSVPFSVVSGGLACIIGALVIARRMPELPRYVHRSAPP